MIKPPTRRVFGPFNRVEGDLEVDVEIVDGLINSAQVNSPLFRGFEQILQGKAPLDALVYTPRICGICSIAQSIAAANALAAASGLTVAANGRLASNILLATENLADHLSHFYLFFMPDFARDHYKDQAWFAEISQRFKATRGSAMAPMLQARAEFLHITGILAGKWPHSLAIQPGGSTRSLEAQDRIRLLTIIASFRQFLESTVFHDALESVAELATLDALEAWALSHAKSDFGLFLHLSKQLNLALSGKATDRFMSYGAYEQDSGFLFEAGAWDGALKPLNTGAITEDLSNSWLESHSEPRHPYLGTTLAGEDFDQGYSWCKAPRLNGEVVEVGAIARQQVHGHPLIRDLVKQQGANVRNRVIARVLELALVVPAIEGWIKAIKPKEAFCSKFEVSDDVKGAGTIEAARGSLGHWVRIKHGRILNYQIIAPTTWNFSPRDSHGTPGALEQALQGTYVGEDAENHIAIQHIVRSFDPCMVCTVH